MNIEIVSRKLELRIYGFSGIAVNKDYRGTAFTLSGKMWQAIKENGIKHKGKNIWVYEANDDVFAGVEPDDSSSDYRILEQRDIRLSKYAYYKHIGPYGLLKQVGANMRDELKGMGLETGLPYIEIYGHWAKDESACETELIMRLV